MSFYVTVVLKTWLCWTSNIAGFYYRQKDTTGTSLVAQWLRIRRGWGFDPWSRKIPHAMGKLNQCATTSEARTP